MNALKRFTTRHNFADYSEYVERYLNLLKVFSFETDYESRLRDTLREMFLKDLLNLVILFSPILFTIWTCYCFRDLKQLLLLSMPLIGFVLLVFYFQWKKYVPIWGNYSKLKIRINGYLKVVEFTGLDEKVLRQYLLSNKQDHSAVFAEALFNETKEAWINDKNLQSTSYERILILYYVLNKKLNIIRTHEELVYLVSCLINVGPSFAAKDIVKFLRRLNDLHNPESKLTYKDLEPIRHYFQSIKSTLKEVENQLDQDMSAIDSLK